MTEDYHERSMRLALEEAARAAALGEIPVGAVILRGEEVIARAHNRCLAEGDPTAHAEMLALREAAKALGRRYLEDCALYVTMEPCPMCAGALSMARIGSVYFGAFDREQGCAGSVYSLLEDPAFFHFARCTGGILEADCRALLQGFFREKRT